MKAFTITIPGVTSKIDGDDALALAVHGEPGSGKTRFCVSAPAPIGFIPLDRKSRKTVKKAQAEWGREGLVYMPTKDFIRTENALSLTAMDEKEAKRHYRTHVDAVKEAAYRFYQHKEIRTVVIDTGTQLWEDMTFAHYGRNDRIMPRDRGPLNQEMIDFLNALSGKNLIITHKSKEIWKNEKPTGKNTLHGFPHIAYHVNVIAEFQVNDKKGPDEEGRFSMNVEMCQDNPDIQGPGGKELLVDEMITFPMLASMVFPDSNAEAWE